jgi:hypothetical protein
MIDQLDVTLRQLFTTRVPGITSDAQVKFQPPDEAWRTYVKTLTVGGNPANALNVYLVDLRENRKLRSNERERAIVNGDVVETVSPRRVDCHYLISAWSPADVTPALEPTLDEHALLYEVARALSQHEPLVPADIFAPAPPPPPVAAESLPTVLMPPEAFVKLAEFWGTMGDQHRWRPCIYLVVTVPIRSAPAPAGPPVTTVIADARQRDIFSTAHVLTVIGGVVTTGAPPVPVERAWVELLTTANVRLQLVRTGVDGRFTFPSVPPGSYRLRASSITLGPSPLRAIDVPSPSGEYDLTL